MDPADLLSSTALSTTASFLSTFGKALRLCQGFCRELYVYLTSHSHSPGGFAIWIEEGTADKWHTWAEGKEEVRTGWHGQMWLGLVLKLVGRATPSKSLLAGSGTPYILLQVKLLVTNSLAPFQHQSNHFPWFLLLKSCSRTKLYSSQTPVILRLNLLMCILINAHVLLFVLWFKGLFFLILA